MDEADGGFSRRQSVCLSLDELENGAGNEVKNKSRD
jgi:hypothetical protein